MDEMSDTRRLVALEEIKLLKARRDRFVDTKDWDTGSLPSGTTSRLTRSAAADGSSPADA